MRLGLRFAAAAVVFAFSATTAFADAPARLWRICAGSDLIVHGTVSVQRDFSGHIAINSNGWASIEVAVDQTLKGVSGDSVTVQQYARNDAAQALISRLLALDGRKAVLFLVSAGGGNGERWFFAGYLNGIEAASAGEIRNIKAEIARQLLVLRNWRPHADKRFTPVVRRLIDETTTAERERAAFKSLEELGEAAVPTIIDLMDDRRTLPIQQISLRNKSPKAFEALRHYGPKKVVDALAAILNQICGEGFGFIYNGASDADRAREVRGWRIYQDVLLNHRNWLH